MNKKMNCKNCNWMLYSYVKDVDSYVPFCANWNNLNETILYDLENHFCSCYEYKKEEGLDMDKILLDINEHIEYLMNKILEIKDNLIEIKAKIEPTLSLKSGLKSGHKSGHDDKNDENLEKN